MFHSCLISPASYCGAAIRKATSTKFSAATCFELWKKFRSRATPKERDYRFNISQTSDRFSRTNYGWTSQRAARGPRYRLRRFTDFFSEPARLGGETVNGYRYCSISKSKTRNKNYARRNSLQLSRQPGGRRRATTRKIAG